MIEVSLLTSRDIPELANLWNVVNEQVGFACTLTAGGIEEHVLLHGGEPRAILAVDPSGWLVARGGGKLLGFAHCTVGRLYGDDPETLRGILRALIVRPDASSAVVTVLLRAAEYYFRDKNNVRSIIAFHPHTGYAILGDGRGSLLHQQWDLMSAFGEAGYQLTQRWLLFSREFESLIPEQLPDLPGLRLVWDDVIAGEINMMVKFGIETIARARFVILVGCKEQRRLHTASLFFLGVSPDYQRKGIGHWLLERGINRLVDRGISRLMVDAPHEDVLFQRRLRRLMFRELPQRGYTYEKNYV